MDHISTRKMMYHTMQHKEMKKGGGNMQLQSGRAVYSTLDFEAAVVQQ